MFSKLKSIIRRSDDQQDASLTDPATLRPAHDLYVVGDIHGSLTALKEALERVEEHAEKITFDPENLPRLVFVGDYVDRGARSAEVLESLMRIQTDLPDRIVCLMGNHERMMIDFIDDPVDKGALWLRNGGMETLASFGVNEITSAQDVEDLIDVCAALEAAMPEGLLDWLRGLPLIHTSGNVCVVHAAMDPFAPADTQTERTLLWGHRDFLSQPRKDGIWVAHGHTIFKQPHCHNSRIAVDTGAYRTGHLTVAHIRRGGCQFI